jgi:hypothetical protein
MKAELLGKTLLNSLIDGTIPFADVMNAYDVRTTLNYHLPSHVLGFVYVSRRGNYHLILNGKVNYETQYKTFVHEIKHISYDLPKAGYVIGLNMQHSALELEADYVAESFAEYAVGR